MRADGSTRPSLSSGLAHHQPQELNQRVEFKVTLKKNRASHSKWDQNRIRKEPILRQYLVLAHQTKRTIELQPGRTLREIAGWIGFTPARMSQIMNLLFLSSSIQESILLSDEPFLHNLTVNEANLIARELMWEKQREMWICFRDKER